MLEILDVLIRGIFSGTLYFLAASGMSLIYGVMKIVNFVHGEYVMLGAYITYFLFTIYSIDPLFSLLIVLLLLFIIGIFIEKYMIEHTIKKPMLQSLLLTYGLSLFIISFAIYYWTTTPIWISYLQEPIVIGEIIFPKNKAVVALLSILFSVGLFTFLKYTNIGKAIRAVSQNQDVALLCGIDVKTIRMISYGLGASLAGTAGSFIIIILWAYPSMGMLDWITKIFAIVILGGMGSVLGSLFGAIIMGVIESCIINWVSARLSIVAAFMIIFLVLLLKPEGLMGEGK